jgi:hypothetical protein
MDALEQHTVQLKSAHELVGSGRVAQAGRLTAPTNQSDDPSVAATSR